MTKSGDREEAILDAAAGLLSRLGYDKLTMGDVAHAVGLHRGLVYRSFGSKDELVGAVVLRELGRYGDAWRAHLEADPRGGTVASVFRATVRALKTLPLAAAIVTGDQDVFGKYLRRRGNLVSRLSSNPVDSAEHLRAMQHAGAIRRDVDTRAVAFILDALTPAIRRWLHTGWAGSAGGRPSSDELMDTLAEMLERTLTPPDADLSAGRAVLLDGLERAAARFRATSTRS